MSVSNSKGVGPYWKHTRPTLYNPWIPFPYSSAGLRFANLQPLPESATSGAFSAAPVSHSSGAAGGVGSAGAGAQSQVINLISDDEEGQ